MPKKVDFELKRSDSSTQIISYLSPGFISSKVLRCQILHSFLNDTFGNYPFTMNNILDKMPIDLYFKIIGSTVTPNIFLQFPMLRFVLLKFFPQRILDAISFNDSHKIIKNLLDKLEKEFYIVQCIQKDKYILRHSLILSYLQISIPVFFIHPNSIELFWQFVEISNRIENYDNSSSNLWLKRWSLKEAIQNIKPENSLVYKFINIVGFQSSHSIRQPENLVSKYGYDLIFFNKFLPLQSNELSREDIIIHKFCMKFDWENPRIDTKLPHETHNDIFDENYYLTDLVAKSRITTGGIIKISKTKWKEILLLVRNDESLTWRDISNKFMFLFTNFKNIQSRFNFTSALTIAQTFQNKKQDQIEFIEFDEKRILSHFNIINQQLVVKNEIGELSEAFKRFLLCPLEYYSLTQAESFFSEYIWSYSTEAQLLLKISGIYSQNDIISYQKKKPKKHNQIEGSLIKGPSFYSELKNLLKILILAGDNHNQEVPITLGDTSASYYLLHQEIFVYNFNYHLIDFIIEGENNDDEIYSKTLSKFSNYVIQLNEIKRKINLRFHRIPFPQLPSFSIQIDTSFQKEEKPPKKTNLKMSCDMKINQNVNYLFAAIREFYLIVSQINDFQNGILNPFVCFSYGFILYSNFDGLDLNSLRKNFYLYYNTSIFDELILSLEFLEEFNYIRKKQSSTSLPIYVSDAYYLRDEKEYYWTNIYHQVDEQILIKQYSIIFEKIELNPGISLFDLYLDIKYLSISNLLDIVNVLILDEAIYMTTLVSSDEDSLFEDTLFLPIRNLSIDHILVLFYLKQVEPTCNIPIIRLYPTVHGALNNQCLF